MAFLGFFGLCLLTGSCTGFYSFHCVLLCSTVLSTLTGAGQTQSQAVFQKFQHYEKGTVLIVEPEFMFTKCQAGL